MTTKDKNQDHHHDTSGRFDIKVITVSDTRTIEDDESGDIIESKLENAGHNIVRDIVTDEKLKILKSLSNNFDAFIFCGGTGISSRDVTYDTFEPIFDKKIPGFGEYFRKLSFEEVGSRAILTRATAGSISKKAIFVIPGSSNAAKIGAKIISKEISHIINHLKK